MTHQPLPFISIVTLNYNQTPITIDFLKSTELLKFRNFETLVCDMGSNIDPTDEINALNIPNTRVLRSEENLGFTGGNNWGMRQAKGDYVFIVNNDTEVTPDLLDELLAPFHSDPTIGVTSPKIRFYHHPNVIQYAGFNEIDVFTGRASAVGSKEEDKGQHDTSGYTHGAHGCAMLVKREVIDKVGMFPEKFFIYYEEWDWSSRIKKPDTKFIIKRRHLFTTKNPSPWVSKVLSRFIIIPETEYCICAVTPTHGNSFASLCFSHFSPFQKQCCAL